MRQKRAILGLAGMLMAAAPDATAQPLAGWTGSIRCDLQAQAPGYSHQEMQTWTLTGGAPTVEGSVTVYPATWSVTGQGWHDRSRNNFRRVAQWTVNNAPVNARIGFTMHPLGRQFDVAKRHAQLTIQGGYTGPEQYVNDGVAQPPGRLVMTVYEWQFPKIEAAASDTQLTGSNRSEVRAFVGPLQPAEAQAMVTCTWALARGSAPSLPASTMQPSQPPASGGAVSGGSAPGGGAVAGGATAGGGAVGGGAAPAGGSTASPLGSAPGSGAPASTATVSLAPGSGSSAARTPGAGSAGGLTAAPGTGGVTAATAVDPSNFVAKQTADGTVVLSWDAVTGAGSYLVGGPGTNVGVMVTGTSHTVTGIPPGAQTWTVATAYNPGGILTTSDKWSKATTTVVNTSGRYRVVAAGFRVLRPTFDDRLNGNGDEVYFSAAITTLDRRNDSVLHPRTIVRSATYGDTSRDAARVRAGSYTPNGGLWGGDIVPGGGDPWAVSGSLSATRFPLALWEGTLRDGVEAVVIHPVLWEEDGQAVYYSDWADPNNFYRKDSRWADPQAAAVKHRASIGDVTPFRGQRILYCRRTLTTDTYCGAQDRPIGMNADACFGPKYGDVGSEWCEITVVITREGVEKALSAIASTGGIPAGVIAIPLVEPPGVDLVTGGFDGNYELYLRVERLP